MIRFADFRESELQAYDQVPKDERPVMTDEAIEGWIKKEYRRLHGKFAPMPGCDDPEQKKEV